MWLKLGNKKRYNALLKKESFSTTDGATAGRKKIFSDQTNFPKNGLHFLCHFAIIVW